jgi:hypothetical protein
MINGIKSDLKIGGLGANGSLSHRHPKLLLSLYQCKGLKIARAGAPSPLSTLSGRQTNS